MKKLLAFTAIAVLAGMPMALADDHDGKKRGGYDRGAKMFEKMDTDGDGQISRAEFDAFHGERFNKMDANSDGYITTEEAAAVREEWKEKMKERRGERKGGKRGGQSPVDTEGASE
jgi:hypothetical protein